jgi:serine/threonine protein kinase
MDDSRSPGARGRPTRLSERVDEACDRFEAAWRAGSAPRIEDYLAEAAAADRAALLGELVALERELRRCRGERVDPQEYRDRFPEDRQLVHEAFGASSSSRSSEGPGGAIGPTLVLEAAPPPDPRRIPPEGSGVADSGPHAGGNLGPYQPLELLGEGGMGRVYKARHRWLKRIVALKIIREDIADGVDAIRRFRREIEAVGRLAHPNIVLALDAGVVDGKHFMVMEYVDGISLSRLVQDRGPLPVEWACDCIRQAALGLRHVHEHSLVHRDIKPANLLMTQGSMVKVADLGLARLHESGRLTRTLTQDGSLIGTPDYLAPEQAATPHLADIRADIYSLGCTFYYLLAGRPPFSGGSYLEKLVRHRECEPEPIERHRADVPPTVCQIVHKMMAKRPEDRYQAPAEVVEAIGPDRHDAGPHHGRPVWPGVVTLDLPIGLGGPAPSRTPSRRGPFASSWLVGTWTMCLAGLMIAGLLLLRGPGRSSTLPGPDSRRDQPGLDQVTSVPTRKPSGISPQDRGGKRDPSPTSGAGPSNPGARAREREVTADVRKRIENGQYYKLSGPAGLRYFVVGTDVVLDHAQLQGDALSITLKVKKSNRGIELLNLGGLAELEFTPDGARARLIKVPGADQTINFDRPGTLVVRIQDVSVLGGNWSSHPHKF